MKRIVYILVFVLCVLLSLCSITRAQVSSSTARAIRTGANLPATCRATAPAEVFVKTGSGAGLYFCSATNTWTDVGSTGGGGDMVLADVQTVTGAKTFNSAKLILAGATSGTTVLNAAAEAGTTTVTLPATTGTVALTANKLSVFASTTSAEIAGVISDETGSGALVFGTSPSLTTPSLGVASATSVEVSDEAYNATNWNGDNKVPTKNAIRDKIESIPTITITDSTIPKGSSGNLVNSSITDDGTTVLIDKSAAELSVTTNRIRFGDLSTEGNGLFFDLRDNLGTIRLYGNEATQFQMSTATGTVEIGDIGNSSNGGKITVTDDTGEITLAGEGVNINGVVNILTNDSRADMLRIKTGNAAIFSKVGGVYHNDTSAVGNVGTGEDNLIVKTVDAGVLATDGQSLPVEMAITLAANTNNKRIKIHVGSTVVLDTTAVPYDGGVLTVSFRITRTGATSQRIQGVGNLTTSVAMTPMQIGFAINTTASETLAGTFVIKATGEATANDDIVQNQLLIKFDPAP